MTMARRRRKKSEAMPVSEAILSALTQSGMKNMARRFEITQIYADTVGKVVAKRSHPVGFSAGVLILKSQSTAWQNELTFLKEDLKARLNEALGSNIIQDIRVVAGNKYADPEPPLPADTPGEWCDMDDHPDDLERIEETLKAVGDPDVRESMRKMMRVAARRDRYESQNKG